MNFPLAFDFTINMCFKKSEKLLITYKIGLTRSHIYFFIFREMDWNIDLDYKIKPKRASLANIKFWLWIQAFRGGEEKKLQCGLEDQVVSFKEGNKGFPTHDFRGRFWEISSKCKWYVREEKHIILDKLSTKSDVERIEWF